MQQLSERGTEVSVIKSKWKNIQDAVVPVWKWGQESWVLYEKRGDSKWSLEEECSLPDRRWSLSCLMWKCFYRNALLAAYAKLPGNLFLNSCKNNSS